MAQKLTYTQCGDYYIPDIRLEHTGIQTLGKYGRMYKAFLEQNKPMLFNDMILSETLFSLLECGYTEADIETALPDDMNVYYSKDNQHKYGVVGIRIALL